MSEFEQTEEPRVLEEIDANEVSLVDHPAIQRTFLIVKRHSENDMPREEIDLEENEEQSEEQTAEATEGDAGAEKDEEGAVTEDSSDGAETADDADTEKEADPTKVMEAAAELLPWLRAQAQEAEGELKGQLDAFLEALGDDEMPEGEGEGEDEEAKAEDSEMEEEEEESEKSEQGWQEQLDAVNTQLADVSKSDDEKEKEAEKSEDGSDFVTTETFNAFAEGVTNALGQIASSMTKVSKRMEDFGSFTPVSKAEEDAGAEVEATEEVSKAASDDKLFAGLISTKR